MCTSPKYAWWYADKILCLTHIMGAVYKASQCVFIGITCPMSATVETTGGILANFSLFLIKNILCGPLPAFLKLYSVHLLVARKQPVVLMDIKYTCTWLWTAHLNNLYRRIFFKNRGGCSQYMYGILSRKVWVNGWDTWGQAITEVAT